jgi:hypothetical protein
MPPCVFAAAARFSLDPPRLGGANEISCDAFSSTQPFPKSTTTKLRVGALRIFRHRKNNLTEDHRFD